MDSTVVVDHDGLFIFIDPGFPGFYREITVIRHSLLYENWREYFTQNDEYTEYLLGDPDYNEVDMFIMRIGA
jgi:hypothetical protein